MVWAAMKGSGELIVKRMRAVVDSEEYKRTLLSAKDFLQPKYALRNAFAPKTAAFCPQAEADGIPAGWRSNPPQQSDAEVPQGQQVPAAQWRPMASKLT
jgi:hypothetical protein